MSFEEILTDCLASLDAGATIDECLAQHPDHAEQLQPLLQIAAGLHSRPAPRLSSSAFDRGRDALWAEAWRQRANASRRPTPAPTSQPARHWRFNPRRMRRRPPSVFSAFHLVTGALVIALLLLSASTLVRNTGNSLPGDTLYTLKRSGETVEGLLMTAAGERAIWHMRQAERRFNESLTIPTIGIGAGVNCDGQVLVTHDLLGMFDNVPSFVKKYANLAPQMKEAVASFMEEVRSGQYPDDEHSFSMKVDAQTLLAGKSDT